MATKEVNHLELWDKVEKTDPNKTKKAQLGQLTITAINAISQIKVATEQFGTYGDGFGLKDIKYDYMDIGQTKLALVGAIFYYPKGEFQLHTSIKVTFMTNGGKGYLKIDDDFMKKAETDLVTKALSKLGFNSDVFMGLYDDNRYVNQMQNEFNPPPPPQKITQDQVFQIEALITETNTNRDEFIKFLNTKNFNIQNIDQIAMNTFKSVYDILNQKKQNMKKEDNYGIN